MDTLKDVIRLKKGVTLCFPKGGIRGYHVLLLTPAQINRTSARETYTNLLECETSGKECKLYWRSYWYVGIARSSRYTPSARALPTILSGLTTGLLSGGMNNAISGKGVGDGLYLHKHDKCYRVQKMKGDVLYLAPHPRFVEGDGLFLKHGEDISDGAGLLMGKNSSF